MAEEAVEHHVKGFLILNWKSQEVRVIKRLNKSKLSPTDIPIKLDITLRIPRPEEFTIRGEVILSQANVEGLAIDALDSA